MGVTRRSASELGWVSPRGVETSFEVGRWLMGDGGLIGSSGKGVVRMSGGPASGSRGWLGSWVSARARWREWPGTGGPRVVTGS
jgi:hypothetical protein